eukprot:TRINITY_DN3343_c0_g1_i2.p1 TRINITY_DN3343_c0_g1~~TRINITY_DN3343_c0_g1_i2.p1  ORF type:complete len:133 (+),score=13.21 TRINITY_DN3343_c0_g1_i2:1124-1522(+)
MRLHKLNFNHPGAFYEYRNLVRVSSLSKYILCFGQVVDGVLIDLMQEICRKPVNLVQDEVINKGGWQIFARISCSSRTSSLPPCDGLAERHQSSRSNSLQVTEYRVDSSEMGQPLLNSSDHRESSSTCKCNV